MGQERYPTVPSEAMDAGAEQFARLERFAGSSSPSRRRRPPRPGRAGDGRRPALAATPATRWRRSTSSPPAARSRRSTGCAATCSTTSASAASRRVRRPAQLLPRRRRARRRGLPILLATVMIEVGRRVGVAVVGVGMPMHFLVRDAADADAFADPSPGVPRPPRGAAALRRRCRPGGCRGTTATSSRPARG